MAEFICNLKKYRLLKELTQEQLAEKVGVRRETIMRLEAGKYNPSLKLAIDISRVVETPIEELFIFDYALSDWTGRFYCCMRSVFGQSYACSNAVSIFCKASSSFPSFSMMVSAAAV